MANPKPSVPSPDIIKAFDDKAGVWNVLVKVGGAFVEVASNCEEWEAEQAMDDLCRWKRGE